MTPALLARLLSGEGAALLASLPPYDEAEAFSLGDRLRGEGFDADLVAAALTQSRLRARGERKFGEAAHTMLFTVDGLEQATRQQVARLHARRLSDSGGRRLFDLGCGVGADARAFAEVGLRVAAVDADEVTAAVADFNLRAWPHATVTHDLAENVALPSGPGARDVAVWLDPARRTPGVSDIQGRTRRTFRLDQLAPSWDLVRELSAGAAAAGVKLSPSFPHARIPLGTQAQWTSYDGEVVECVLWWNDAAWDPGRSAVVVSGQFAHEVLERDAEGANPEPARLDRLHGYLYEADRAIIRAGLSGALVRRVDGAELDTGVGVVTSPRDVVVPWAKKYAVTDAIPFNIKALRSWVRDNRIGHLTIKKKGASVDPAQLRRQLRLRGDNDATILVTRVGGAQAVLMLVPVR
ncbi:MAG TPA: class I SAM-dependent methyltransferase [Flexivirga sp.]|uniref:class I SAM-dependent methyltransferase n=1 Tax=Flexivirga sp. TaxID=1962927 RepID=UPI002CB167BF|nr:class I SAM-dependent methyltransferase [Flexivirga sp.]HWC24764.1 class I SAM-dependent methyltransferase [Flexivirga sp.]